MAGSMPQTGTSLAPVWRMDARRGRRRVLLGSTVLVALALACGWPQSADAAGKRSIRNRVGAVGRPQGKRPGNARRRVLAPRPGIALAAALRRRALMAEPQVTSSLRATLASTGGTLVDFDQRIKPSRSLFDKLRRDRRDTGQSLERVGGAIADVLRYKVVLPFASYEATRRDIVRALEGRGYAVVKSKDNWGTRYPGHNLQVRSPGGYVFEIQFQTHASHEANRRTHDLYRLFRESSGDQAIELERRILDITGGVPMPHGVGQRDGMTRSNEVMTPR
jgi:hypothetical protein